MSLELAYWKKVAELVYESYADVNFDLLGEDIKVAKSMYEPYAAAEVVVWGCADKSYQPKEPRTVIQARLLNIQINSGLFDMVPLSF